MKRQTETFRLVDDCFESFEKKSPSTTTFQFHPYELYFGNES